MFDNTKEIKDKIVDGHKRGVCDKNGNTLRSWKHRNHAGKGDMIRPCDWKKYEENYEAIFRKGK